MSFSCKLYIDLAEELIVCPKINSLEEAYFRSSVSRAYYGVFLVARSLAESRGEPIPRNRSTHQYLKDYFLQSNNKLDKKIGNILKGLLIERKKADYDVNNESFDDKRANDAFQRAKKALAILKKVGAIC